MADANRRQFDAVVVWKFDRFARSVSHLLKALEAFEALGISFVSLSESVDTSTPAGKMVFTVLGAVAELERSLIGERVRAGLRNAEAKGVKLGRPSMRQFSPADIRRLRQERRKGASFKKLARQFQTSVFRCQTRETEGRELGVYLRKFRKTGRKIWWLSFTHNFRQVFESSHSTSRRFAEKLLAIRRAEVAEARYHLPRSNPPTLELWGKEYVKAIPNASTRRRYSTSLVALVAFFKQDKISQISAEQIEGFKKARRLSGIKPSSINRDLSLMRLLMKAATRQRLIGQNPFDSVEFLEERSGRRQATVLSFDGEEKLLAACDPLLRVLSVLLVETGLRVGHEALGLTWVDLDLANETVVVRQAKTVAGRRTIPLSKFCIEELTKWQNLTGTETSPFVFPAPSDNSKHLMGVRRSWGAALKAAKLPYFPIYNICATFASRLSAAGVPDVFVSQLMGHAGSLLGTYSKATLDYRIDAIRKLEEFREKSKKSESRK
jgi:DNA invertase Pin-like site-specific DNA recombinase/site-specific recombinase XerD